MPVLLAEFGGPGPRGVIGHFLGMVIGFEFLVQIFVCWAQGLCFHKYEYTVQKQHCLSSTANMNKYMIVPLQFGGQSKV
jgi:hypothetical protein